MSSATPSRPYAWYVVGVLTLANVSSFVDRQILALLSAPIQRDLGLSLSEVGALIGFPFAIFFTVMGLPLARLADATSRRTVIGVGIALWSLATALSGLAGTYARLMLARIGVGVGEASLQAPAVSLIGDYFPPERRASAQGVYATGIFIGSGLAYFIGGWIVGLVSTQEQWTLPLIGAIRPWQTVFLMVGAPGLLIAALMLTVREPARQDQSRGTAPLSELWRWVRDNRFVVGFYVTAFTASATANYAIALWLNRWLSVEFAWSPSKAGMVQGVFTMIFGTLSVMAGGRLADWFASRGDRSAAIRVGIIASVGLLISAVATFELSTAATVMVGLAFVNIFAALPWGAVQAGFAQLVPVRLKSQGVALFVLILNLVSFSLGPFLVGYVADTAFAGAETKIGLSITIVTAVGLAVAIVLLSTLRSRWPKPSESSA
jgi:MFS family permease